MILLRIIRYTSSTTATAVTRTALRTSSSVWCLTCNIIIFFLVRCTGYRFLWPFATRKTTLHWRLWRFLRSHLNWNSAFCAVHNINQRHKCAQTAYEHLHCFPQRTFVQYYMTVDTEKMNILIFEEKQMCTKQAISGSRYEIQRTGSRKNKHFFADRWHLARTRDARYRTNLGTERNRMI